MTIGAGLVLVGCGDDDDDAKDGGEHGDHGDHDDDDAGAGRGGGGGRAGTGSAGRGGRGGGGGADDDDAGTPLDVAKLSFFVTSDTSKTGNLAGLKGADERCNRLAKAAGATNKTFAAYLSAEKNEKGEDAPVNARDRIGKGPWYNAKGVMVAKDLDALHALPAGNADLFLTEKGTKINGQWEGSPTPNEHDVLTGSSADGKLLENKTCKAWTSESMSDVAQVGHSDGLGPMRDATPPRNSWNSAHENGGCNDTAPRGGAGHIYCFATK